MDVGGGSDKGHYSSMQTPNTSPRNGGILNQGNHNWFPTVARFFVVVGGTSLLVTTMVSKEQVESVNSVLLRGIEVPKTKVTPPSKSGTKLDDTFWPSQNGKEENHEPDGPWPRVAWLMSFPNSGTSYTGQLVKHLTNTNTASNYGESNVDKRTGNSAPIFPGNWDGPFWVDPSNQAKFSNPTKYILTKTHCGGYRTNAPPELYVESTHSFRRRCLGTKYIRRKQAKFFLSNTNSTKPKVSLKPAKPEDNLRGEYNYTLVGRAIHLLRNPMDNVVSRFNFDQKRLPKAVKKNITKSKEGFREFCRRMDEAWKDAESTSIIYDPPTLELLEKVPCHSDFVRYAEWHNQAFVTTQDLGIETMILHYEDYITRFNKTTAEILDFLELEPTGYVRTFVKGKVYHTEYFTPEERMAVSQVLHRLSLQVTWKYLIRYFT